MSVLAKRGKAADFFSATVIHVQGKESPPKEEASGSSDLPTIFRRMEQPRFKQALNEDWNYLLIESSNETSDMDIAVEVETEQSAETLMRDQPSDQSGSQAEALKLYVVGSSKTLETGQPSGVGRADEEKATA